MEVTKDFLDGLTPTDLDNINAYQKLLGQVRSDLAILKEQCLFQFGQNELSLDKAEWLTHDGLWHHGDRSIGYNVFSIKLDEDILFNLYKEYRCDVGCRPQVAQHMPVFLKRIEKLRGEKQWEAACGGGIVYTCADGQNDESREVVE